MPASPEPAPASAPPRRFGRWPIVRLVGKSERTMAWEVSAPEAGGTLLLVLPRAQPADREAAERWLVRARRTARIDHPRLARVHDIGVQDGWPYVAYEPAGRVPLPERLDASAMPAAEAALVVERLLEGLAFAHEAGAAHRDLQAHFVLAGEGGDVALIGLDIAPEEAGAAHDTEATAAQRREQREEAERDVLAAGLLAHRLLVGAPALDEPDLARAIDRMPPRGREIVRLPWQTPRPVPEALRAIVNRATDRQERQRYRNARTLARALEGWRAAEGGGAAGPLALLGDRLRHAGVLPASPGGAERAARLALMERERTHELAGVVLEDVALAFELLRAVNSAQLRSGSVGGNGPVLTIRRAIAMLGLDGVRRAALGLRRWPGPLAEAPAAELAGAIAHARRAGRIAMALRPAAYDDEVIYLVALLQNLGRLVVQYHFPDEAAQIRRLMQPAPAPRVGEPEEPGMNEATASFAVLGADTEAIGQAVARQWGLPESVAAMLRRLPAQAPVRTPEGDEALLRTVASCANEVADAAARPAAAVLPALHRVAQRYGRLPGLALRDLTAALQPGTLAAGPEPADTRAAPLEALAEGSGHDGR
jgi:non-specific serine/threonine protein kinase